jgi:uncharacterized MAPEG superfamily protein
MVVFAGLLPYVATLVAKWGFRDYDGREPRVWLARQTGVRGRANAAQLNSFEAFPFFAAAVLVAEVRGATGPVDELAVGFILARTAYLAAYLLDRPVLRVLFWVIGILIVLAIFGVASMP